MHTLLKTCFWSCDFSDWLKCHDTIFRNFSQGYCIHLPNMKRIRFMAAKLMRKENTDPANPVDLAESLLPYTKKRRLITAYTYTISKCTSFNKTTSNSLPLVLGLGLCQFSITKAYSLNKKNKTLLTLYFTL